MYQILRPKGILDSPSEIAGVGLETLFYQSALAFIAYHKLDVKIYYWRTENGVEVDFVFYGGKTLLAIEIKHTQVIHSRMLHGLKQFKNDYPIAKSYLFYLGKQRLFLENDITVIPFVEALSELGDLLGI